MKHFLNGNMLIVVCRMARVWLKIQWFCNFCKFTNKNIRLLFKYQGLQVECSTLLQKIQLYLLHRTPIDPPTLVPCRSLAFFVSNSVLFSARTINLVVFFQKSISKFHVFILIRSKRTPYHAMGSTLEHPWASYRVAKVAFALCKAVQKIFRYPYLNLHLELLYSKSAKIAKFIDSQAILPTTKGIKTFKKCFLSIWHNVY